MAYAHSAFPGHSQNSGACLPDETARYLVRLAVARDEIKGDLEAIEQSDRPAIVIVAGDHGPFLTGDCLYMQGTKPEDLSVSHLADRYGTMLAIRWPPAASRAPNRLETIQDVFLAVSAYLLDDDRAWRRRGPAVTTGYGGIPGGAVRSGVVTIGRDRGQPLLGK